jgi:electron transport complex protein RnfG
MRRTAASASFHTALNLAFFALIGTAILAFIYHQTHERIAQSVENEKLKLISQILPKRMYDNDMIKDKIKVEPDALLGNDEITTAYRARLNGKPSVVVLEAVAPDGYSGKIYLIVAIRENGELSGVRVVSHKETPGLGDYIDIAKSAWIKGFDGKSTAQYNEADWQVKKDGGKFDYMAGATITPRAVVKAVHKALLYFALHKDALFAQKGELK